MSTMLNRFDAEEALAAHAEDFTNTATAIVNFGLVSREGDGYDVMNLGFARGSATVSSDLRDCSICESVVCVHREAARLFIEQPEKQPTPARRVDDDQGPNKYTAKTMRALITPKQCVAIRIIANSRGLDPRELSHERYGCDYERLSIYWAGKFYEALCEIRDSRRAERSRKLAG